MVRKVVLVSGGFDPIHSGHINLIKEAKKLGDVLIVAANSNEWLVRKKGKFFLPIHERASIIGELKSVDNVMCLSGSEDEDNSACKAIQRAKKMYPNDIIVFANGGDRGKDNIPEIDMWGEDPQVEFVFGVGGDFKKNSSSWILEKWENQ